MPEICFHDRFILYTESKQSSDEFYLIITTANMLSYLGIQV